MPNNDPWDDIPKGDFWTWENPGEFLAGDIISKTIDEDFNGKPAPCLGIRQDDGTEVLLTAGQAQLKAKLLEAKPAVGDRIKITFTQVEKRGGGKTLKHFEVQLKSGGAKSPVAPPTQEAPSTPIYGDDEDF